MFIVYCLISMLKLLALFGYIFSRSDDNFFLLIILKNFKTAVFWNECRCWIKRKSVASRGALQLGVLFLAHRRLRWPCSSCDKRVACFIYARGMGVNICVPETPWREGCFHPEEVHAPLQIRSRLSLTQKSHLYGNSCTIFLSANNSSTLSFFNSIKFHCSLPNCIVSGWSVWHCLIILHHAYNRSN